MKINKKALKYTGSIVAIVFTIFALGAEVPIAVWFKRITWWQLLAISVVSLKIALFVYCVFAYEFEDDNKKYR